MANGAIEQLRHVLSPDTPRSSGEVRSDDPERRLVDEYLALQILAMALRAPVDPREVSAARERRRVRTDLQSGGLGLVRARDSGRSHRVEHQAENHDDSNDRSE